MSKRAATSDLNHENWDICEEEEDAGTFKMASKEVITSRKMKVAKRRSNISSTGSPSSSPFSSFTGFKPQTPSSKPLFNLTPGNSILTTNGADQKVKQANTFSFSSNINIPNNPLIVEKENTSNKSSEQEYVANLTELNKKVCEWIKLHVDKSPLCILTPVFNDYERYLKEIRAKRSTPVGKSNISENSSPLLRFKPMQESGEKESVPKESKSEIQVSSVQPSIFSGIKSGSESMPTGQSILLKKPDPASFTVKPFTLKLSDTSEKPADSVLSGVSQTAVQLKPFSFGGSSQPFTFSNVTTQPSSNDSKDQEEEESEEPPKPDFKPVQEEGSVFSKRCKVFVKKDSNYADLGIGTLFVKKVSEAKYQLLVRADTVLGNVLVNILLSSGVPTKRMGKNNVMLICLPTPDATPPPTTVLLRVKTSEEADDLLQKLEQYKN